MKFLLLLPQSHLEWESINKTFVLLSIFQCLKVWKGMSKNVDELEEMDIEGDNVQKKQRR